MENLLFTVLILIAGLLLCFIGVMPLLSRKYFDEMSAKFWHDKKSIIPDSDAYIFNRYIRQVGLIVTGVILLIYALNQIL